MFLEVQCPLCLEDGSDKSDTLILLGDDEQNMQCTNCGYASNKDYKNKVVEFPQDFQSDQRTHLHQGINGILH